MCVSELESKGLIEKHAVTCVIEKLKSESGSLSTSELKIPLIYIRQLGELSRSYVFPNRVTVGKYSYTYANLVS